MNDFTFNGDQEKWVACARTLQARITLNWAEVNGASAYTEALALAGGGVSDPTGAVIGNPFIKKEVMGKNQFGISFLKKIYM